MRTWSTERDHARPDTAGVLHPAADLPTPGQPSFSVGPRRPGRAAHRRLLGAPAGRARQQHPDPKRAASWLFLVLTLFSRTPSRWLRKSPITVALRSSTQRSEGALPFRSWMS